MIRANRYRAFAFIALWQAAPVVVEQDSTGRVQIHFAGGGGQYEQITTTCEGDVLDVQRRGYTGGGGGAQVWLVDWARLNAFATVLSTGTPPADDVYSGEEAFGGLGVGALLALEFRYVGVGLGIARFDELEALPMPYLRAGNIDGVHLRADAMSAEGTSTMNGLARLGLGYNQGHLRGTRAFVGIAGCHAGCDGNAPLGFIEMATPIADRWDVRVAGLAGPGTENAEFGLTLGVTWLPSPVSPAGPVISPAPERP